MRVLRGHTDSVQALAYSPDGVVLASAGNDCQVRLWDTASGTARDALEGHTDAILCLAFVPNTHSQGLVSCGYDRRVRSWDRMREKQNRLLMTLAAPAVALAVSPDGRHVAAGADAVHDRSGNRDTLRVHDLSRLADPPRSWRLDPPSPVWGLAFAPDGRTLAAGLPRGDVVLWAFPEGRERGRLSNPHMIYNLVFSPDGTLLAALTGPEVRLWDAAAGVVRGVLGGEGYRVLSAAFTPDGQALVTGGSDGAVRVWDVRSAAELWRFDWGLGSRIHAVAVAPDGLTAAAAGMANDILVWDLDG
jgi:WD40 repeat protein